MSGKRTPGLRRRGKNGIWSIQKTVSVGGKSIRICETTGTSSLEEAERYLSKRIEELRSIHIYGEASPLTLFEAAERYLEECSEKSFERAAVALAHLCQHLGHYQVRELHDGVVQPYIKERLTTVKAGTVNREIGVLVAILNRCARKWRNGAGKPYLSIAPSITRAKGISRRPYPLSQSEESLLLAECPTHLRQIVKFAIQTGCRAGEIVALRWDWEVSIPELAISVFVLPSDRTKNGEERVVILNSEARKIIDQRRGIHDEFVFCWRGRQLTRLSNSAWRDATARAGLPIRFHDLRHTTGHRLRAVGTPLEDRRALLGHTCGDITTHYSAGEVESLLAYSEKIVDARPSTALRTGLGRNVVPIRQIRGNLPVDKAVPNKA